MKLNYLVYVILKLNIALDSGKYQDVSMEEAREHIDAGDLVAWLNQRVPAAHLGDLSEAHVAELRRDWRVCRRHTGAPNGNGES